MAATNRWGETFKKGDCVLVRMSSGWAKGRYVKLAKPDDFSRAYGRQAVVAFGNASIEDGPSEVGFGDMVLSAGREDWVK